MSKSAVYPAAPRHCLRGDNDGLDTDGMGQTKSSEEDVQSSSEPTTLRMAAQADDTELCIYG